MPTLEDTIDFQASTLNDLLDAEAKSVSLPSESEGKYRSWAFLSTAAAGLLAILLVVTLVTDGGGGGGDGDSAAKAKDYPGKVKQTVRLTSAPTSDIKVDSEVSLFKGGELVAAPVIVSQIIQPKTGTALTTYSVELAMTDEQSELILKAFPKGDEKGRIVGWASGQRTAPAATAPAESTPPAVTTETTPATTAPAATTETTAPASTPPPSG